MSDPAAVLAILGGGQLGRMLALAAARLGVRCRFMDPTPGAVAGHVGELITDSFDHPSRLDDFLRGASAVTFEFENVPAALADRIAKSGTPVRPSPHALRTAQDRLLEKQLFHRLGIGTPPFQPVDTYEQMRAAILGLGTPAVVKTRRFGYDGKGQAVVRSESEILPAWNTLQRGVPGAHTIEPPAIPLIVEGFVPFGRELSVLAVRGYGGELRVYPLTENHHEGGILRVSKAPAPGLSAALQAEGESIARRVSEALDYVGLLAVELFEVDGRLLANEIAPRVHNSGHWTMNGAVTCQFENHVRAVMGWPLGDPSPRGHSGMVNLIGSHPPAAKLATAGTAHLHLYGKSHRPGRKLGHVNVTADTPARRDEAINEIARLVRRV